LYAQVINLDFADLKTAMSTRGYAMMGEGKAQVQTAQKKLHA
jgi:cell division GTPase FtsZ